MDFIETSISINEKSNSSSDINIIKNDNKIFTEEKPYNINLNIKKKVKIRKKFKIPSNLKKTFNFIIVLTIVGIILIFCGIIKAVMKHNIFEGFFFLILSILVLIPGGYYSFQFYKAKRAKSETERKEILDRIPKLQRNIF